MTAPHNGIASENEIKNLERSLSGRFSGIKFSTVMKCQELTMTLPCVSWNFITLPCQQRVGLVRWLQCVTKTASNQLYNFEQIIKPSKWNTDNQLVKVVFCFCLQRTPEVDFSKNPYYEPLFKFYDQRLLLQVEASDADVHEFFRLLALCHTVMPVETVDGKRHSWMISRILTHVDESSGSKAFICVCLCVRARLCVCPHVEPKRLKLRSPNLPQR